MKKIQTIIIGTTILLPYCALAATNKTLADLIGVIAGYFDLILKLMMGFAVIVFVYYVIKYFIQPTDKRDEAISYVMWSILGFFIILSMWGIVNILISTFDLGGGSPTAWTNLKTLFPQ